MRNAVAVALGVSAAQALVCDGDGERVPCFTLSGGRKMPQISMGSWSGSYKDCDGQDFGCIQQHGRFAAENWLRIGGMHLDTANDYRDQTAVGEAIKLSGIPREDIFVTTKCPGAMGYEATMQCADDNLQMLGLLGKKGFGYIDLLLIHFPFTIKPECRFNRFAEGCKTMTIPASKEALQETWRAMEDLKKFGVVKSIGVSDYKIDDLKATLETAKEHIEVHQVEWNPSIHDMDMYSFCMENKIRLQAWSPLGGAAGSVMSNPVVKDIAKAHNTSSAQVVLRWSLQQGVAVVVGTANADHQESDIDVFGFNLTQDEIAKIGNLKPPSIETIVF